jgi:DNA polymerase-3 subunit delta
MDFTAFARLAERGQLPPVVLVHGADPQLVDDALAAATAALFPDASLATLGREVLDGETVTTAEVVRSAMTLPLMTAVRLVAVRRAHALKPVPDLSDYVKDPNPSTCLLLLSDESLEVSRDRRQRHWLLDVVLAQGVVTLGARQGRDLMEWLRQRASQEGLSISADAVQLLVKWVGEDTAALLGEVRKAALVGTGAPGTVGVKDVEAVVGEHRLAGVFELTRAIEKRDVGAAVRTLDRLLAIEEAMRLLALLSGEVRLGWRVKGLTERGQTPDQIARAVHRPFGVVKAHVEAATGTTDAVFATWLRRCREVEQRLKSGGEERAELAALVAELASGRG